MNKDAYEIGMHQVSARNYANICAFLVNDIEKSSAKSFSSFVALTEWYLAVINPPNRVAFLSIIRKYVENNLQDKVFEDHEDFIDFINGVDDER